MKKFMLPDLVYQKRAVQSPDTNAKHFVWALFIALEFK